MDFVRNHEIEITKYALEKMSAIKGLKIYGTKYISKRGGVISFNFADIHPHDLATIIDEEGVAIRSGHHCAQVLMERLDVAATSRASFYIYNTKEEVDVLITSLEKAARLFKL
jgi:cysteine desulfurase/selenocysteine lyase